MDFVGQKLPLNIPSGVDDKNRSHAYKTAFLERFEKLTPLEKQLKDRVTTKQLPSRDEFMQTIKAIKFGPNDDITAIKKRCRTDDGDVMRPKKKSNAIE